VSRSLTSARHSLTSANYLLTSASHPLTSTSRSLTPNYEYKYDFLFTLSQSQVNEILPANINFIHLRLKKIEYK
jgi:hypothetical protein